MKPIRFISFILLALFMSSCFEIIEDISIKEDGSGTLKYVINFSQSKTKIKSLMQMDEVEGYEVPTEEAIEMNFNKFLRESRGVKGISNVEGVCNLEEFIFSYRCDFTSTRILNNAIDSMKTKSPEMEANHFRYFDYNKGNKTFKRTGDDLLKEKYETLSAGQKVIFNGAYYTCIYRFDTEIDTVMANGAKISKSGTTCFKKLAVISLTYNGNAINHEIKLK